MKLILLALLPPLFLMYYVYQQDKVEREPFRLVRKVFLLGVIMVIPILIGEILADRLLSTFMYGRENTILYILIENILCVGLIEEYGKYVAARSIWKSPEFNYRFDGIVYTVAAALGFAAIENLIYVLENGFYVGIMRALLSVPSHGIDGIFMGIYFGEAKLCETYGDIKGKKYNLFKCLLIPTLTHGIYDALLSFDNDICFLLFILFVILLDIIAVRRIKKSSKNDIQIG